MKKPEMKRRIGLTIPSFQKSFIVFNADEETAGELAEFGQVSENGAGSYTLWVDARFDYEDVLAFINDINEMNKE